MSCTNTETGITDTKSETKLAHALRWADRGFSVFPLQENTKEPLAGSNGHLGATTDPQKIREMWTDPLTGSVMNYNIGASPRDGRFLIIDLDVKEGRNGIEEYRALVGEIGGLVVRTTSGGLHVYYATDEALKTGAGDLGTGIDSRGADGYVVAPGSVIDGETYEVMQDDAVLPVPAFVAMKLGTRAERDRTRQHLLTTHTIENDQPANIERFAEHCRRADPASPGVWHDASRDLACEAIRCAVSPEVAIEVMLEHWVPRGTGFFDEGRNERWAADVAGSYQWGLGFGQHGTHSVDAQVAGFQGIAIVPPPALPPPANMNGADRLILDSTNPMESALALIAQAHTIGGQCVLRFQGGTFYRWTGMHYAEATREELGSQVWRFLHGASRISRGELAPFKPTVARVNDVLGAVGAACQMASHVRAPCWLNHRSEPAPKAVVACGNGLLDIETGDLLAPDPAFFTLNSLPFAYDPSAPEPSEWLAFLSTLWPDDTDSRDTLQEIFGLLLTAETRFQKAFLLVGPKRSGKGTIARVLTSLLGQDNVCGPTLGQLGQQFGSAPLIGKRLAIIADARLGGRADAESVAERILNITGEDSQTIDRKFREAWTGKLDARLLIISNELPRLADASGALASRLITLVLRDSFYGREDQGLTDRLTEELPGILNWAIEGWRRLAARKRFNPPQASRDAQQELEDLGSPISVFVRERCEVGPDAKVRPEALFQAWRCWCIGQGRNQPGNLATFGRDVRAVLPNLDRRQETIGGSRLWVYYGVGLLSDISGVVQAAGG